jgi:hypothetical protein
MADANGLPRGARCYPDAEALEMFMYNYPRVRALGARGACARAPQGMCPRPLS